MLLTSTALLTPLLVSPAVATEVRRGGRSATHLRLSTVCLRDDGEDCTFLDFYDTVELGSWAEARPSSGVHIRGEATLRFHPNVAAEGIEDLSQPTIVHPISIRIEEAYIDLYGLGGPHTDLRIGVQEVPWGLGEGLHVVDNINPWDLENPLAIDARLPVTATWLRWHTGIASIEWVAVPFFTPSSLPPSGFDPSPSTDALTSNPVFAGLTIGDIALALDGPEPTPANLASGLRIKLTTQVIDLALSGYHGRDSVPQGDGEVVLSLSETEPGQIDLAIPLTYPKVDILGFEARGELPWQLGAWIEVAEVFPTPTAITVSEEQLQALVAVGALSAVIDPLPTVTTQDGAAFTRWVVGIEKMTGRVHAVVQWLHGFPTERRASDLRDYGAATARFTLSNTTVFALQALSDGDGTIAQVALELLFSDSAEIELGLSWANGSDDSAISAFEGASHAHFGAEVKF